MGVNEFKAILTSFSHDFYRVARFGTFFFFFFFFFLENALFVSKHTYVYIYFATDKCQALGDLTISFAWRVEAGPYGVRCVRKNAYLRTPLLGVVWGSG